MKKQPPPISDAEWKVMEVVWRDHPLTAQEIVLALAEHENWKPQTVKSLISRLVKKGALAFETIANRYSYRPAMERREAVAAETESFFSRVGRSSLAPVLAQFVESKEPLDEDEIAALEKLLRKKGGKK